MDSGNKKSEPETQSVSKNIITKSFKVGEGTSPYAGVSKAQLAQRISRQDEIIRRQDEELAAQKEQIREILAQLEAMKKA